MILRLPASAKQLASKLASLGQANHDLALRGIVSAFSISRDSAPPALAACERVEVNFDSSAPENRRFLESRNVRPTRRAVSRLLSSALRWYSSPH